MCIYIVSGDEIPMAHHNRQGPKDVAAATAPALVEAVPNGTAASVAAGQPGPAGTPGGPPTGFVWFQGIQA